MSKNRALKTLLMPDSAIGRHRRLQIVGRQTRGDHLDNRTYLCDYLAWMVKNSSEKSGNLGEDGGCLSPLMEDTARVVTGGFILVSGSRPLRTGEKKSVQAFSRPCSTNWGCRKRIWRIDHGVRLSL